jgi:hypothetical protein
MATERTEAAVIVPRRAVGTLGFASTRASFSVPQIASTGVRDGGASG